MKTSSTFEKALFYDQTSAIDEVFARISGQLFEQAKERSYLEFHVQRPSNGVFGCPQSSQNSFATLQRWDSNLDRESDSDTPSPTQPFDKVGGPPCYTGTPVDRWRIVSIEDVGRCAKVG